MSNADIYNILEQIRDALSAISRNLHEISGMIPSGSGIEIEELNDTMKEIRDILRRISDK